MKRVIAISIILACSTASFAGAYTVNDTLDIRKSVSSAPSGFLDGRVAGLRVSDLSAPDINIFQPVNIRGVNSIRMDSAPLWIVDGVPSSFSLDSYSLPFNIEDIERVDVVKNISQSSEYGSLGANGVIIVNTRRPSGDAFRAMLKSSVRLWKNNPGFSNTLSAGGASGKSTYFVSGYYNRTAGAIKGNKANSGGIRATFDTKANSVVWFGMNASFSMDGTSAPAREEWAYDYDNDSDGKKITAGTYLVVNFLPTLRLRADAGLDFNDRKRYVWNGPATPEGAFCNGLAVISDRALMNYNASINLVWDRYFAKDHNVHLEGMADFHGRSTRDNTLVGSDFISYDLRAKGINVSGSKPDIFKFDHNYSNIAGSIAARYSFRGIVGAGGRLRWETTPRYPDSGKLFRSLDAFLNLREAFWSNSGVVSGLCLYAGYGEAGSETYVPYGNYPEYLTAFPMVGKDFEMFYDGLCRLYSAEWNVSLDASFFSRRISVQAIFYDKRTLDTFIGYCFGSPVSEGAHYWAYSSGSEQFRRKSVISNKGVEVQIAADVLRGHRVNWSVSIAAAWNANRMEAVDRLDEIGVLKTSGFAGNANVAGRNALSFYGFLLDDALSLKDVTGDGRIDERDCVVLAPSSPGFTGFIGTTLQSGRFAFDFIATAATGYNVLDYARLVGDGAQITTDYLSRGDNFNFRRAAVSYALPTNRVKWLRSVTFCLSAENFLRIGGYRPMLYAPAAYSLSVKFDF